MTYPKNKRDRSTFDRQVRRKYPHVASAPPQLACKAVDFGDGCSHREPGQRRALMAFASETMRDAFVERYSFDGARAEQVEA